MDKKTLYEIEFRYSDNDELYQLPVLLTDSEYQRTAKFLEGLLEAGEIVAADGTDSDTIENVIYEPAERKPLDFTELTTLWKDGTLMRMADANGIQF